MKKRRYLLVLWVLINSACIADELNPKVKPGGAPPVDESKKDYVYSAVPRRNNSIYGGLIVGSSSRSQYAGFLLGGLYGTQRRLTGGLESGIQFHSPPDAALVPILIQVRFRPFSLREESFFIPYIGASAGVNLAYMQNTTGVWFDGEGLAGLELAITNDFHIHLEPRGGFFKDHLAYSGTLLLAFRI